jgi:hypothetical protein
MGLRVPGLLLDERRIACRSSSSSTSGVASLTASINHHSPVGSSRCNTLIMWVENGSPGTQRNGVVDQSKRT